MWKHKKAKHLRKSDWLEFAARQPILDRVVCDPYCSAYPILLSHFKSLPVLNWDAAVRGLHIVYAWMPTIPRLGEIMGWNLRQRRELLLALNTVRMGHEPNALQIERIKRFCNNSFVGASKLLHFLRPDTFPIWDTRVGKAFLRRRKLAGSTVNSLSQWMLYRGAVLGWAQDKDVKAKCKHLKGIIPSLQRASNVRIIELVLFHKTVSKRVDQLK